MAKLQPSQPNWMHRSTGSRIDDHGGHSFDAATGRVYQFIVNLNSWAIRPTICSFFRFVHQPPFHCPGEREVVGGDERSHTFQSIPPPSATQVNPSGFRG